MPKSYTMILMKLDKHRDSIWMGIIRTFLGADVKETPSFTIVGVPVTSYSLTDHQFVEIKVQVDSKNGPKEASILVPRLLVETIFETKDRLDIKGFKFTAS
jgi:hypothetical protein